MERSRWVLLIQSNVIHFFLDFLLGFALSAALLLSLNLALSRLLFIRLFFVCSSSIKLANSSKILRPPLPVFWSIRSRPKLEKRGNSGCWVQVYSKGDVYKDRYQKGKYSGSGFYTTDAYAGEWSNGQSHGCGVHTCEDGSRYVGEFKWGVKHDLGHCHFRAWNVHIQKWENLSRQNGIIDIPSTQNTTHPVSPIAVYHSKEARQAAEKANDVARIDEKVNRAVAAANNAINAARVAVFKAVQKQMHHSNNKDSIPLATL
ncbi:morn repeat-containing protein 1 [Citrus sinensis]|nr:morn repeat-containing protein 1 [Citrus sinensis]